jgi:hypothetical protein
MIKVFKLEIISPILKLKINNDTMTHRNINSIKTLIGDALRSHSARVTSATLQIEKLVRRVR